MFYYRGLFIQKVLAQVDEERVVYCFVSLTQTTTTKRTYKQRTYSDLQEGNVTCTHSVTNGRRDRTRYPQGIYLTMTQTHTY